MLTVTLNIFKFKRGTGLYLEYGSFSSFQKLLYGTFLRYDDFNMLPSVCSSVRIHGNVKEHAPRYCQNVEMSFHLHACGRVEHISDSVLVSLIHEHVSFDHTRGFPSCYKYGSNCRFMIKRTVVSEINIITQSPCFFSCSHVEVLSIITSLCTPAAHHTCHCVLVLARCQLPV